VVVSQFVLSLGHKGSALRVSFSVFQHVPDDCGQLSHHGHTRDVRASSAFDALEPFPEPGIFPQDLVSHLR